MKIKHFFAFSGLLASIGSIAAIAIISSSQAKIIASNTNGNSPLINQEKAQLNTTEGISEVQETNSSTNSENQGSSQQTQTIMLNDELVSKIDSQIKKSKLYNSLFSFEDYENYGKFLINSGTLVNDKFSPEQVRNFVNSMVVKLQLLSELSNKISTYQKATAENKAKALEELQNYIDENKDDANALLTDSKMDLSNYLNEENSIIRKLGSASNEQVKLAELVKKWTQKINQVILNNKTRYPGNLRSQVEDFAKTNSRNLVFKSKLTEAKKFILSKGLILVNAKSIKAFIQNPTALGGGKEIINYALKTLYPTLADNSEEKAVLTYLKYAIETQNLKQEEIILLNKLYGKYLLEDLWAKKDDASSIIPSRPGGGSAEI
ncbi:hypothetical protein NPA08_00950 [Mycoplasmopsis citelli]|uniref:hypothetical protein n=1 Tax=Mycoplasmopsis citelli TaxID=171281 RepID=UPI002114A42E|nr:hypothetical protein [Mycoplasmopsis citelli]UUD36391.1 hypothetical protein NPA08_00950 [Mycoplasmopsis citelli]